MRRFSLVLTAHTMHVCISETRKAFKKSFGACVFDFGLRKSESPCARRVRCLRFA